MTGIYLLPISASGKAAEDVASRVTRFLEMFGQVTIVCKWRCLLRKSQLYCPVFSILVTVLPYVCCSDYLVMCPGYYLIPTLSLNLLGEHLYFFLFDCCSGVKTTGSLYEAVCLKLGCLSKSI